VHIYSYEENGNAKHHDGWETILEECGWFIARLSLVE
jgi:hypothetical protein